MMPARLMSEMVSHQSPMTVRPGATIAEVCQQMREQRVGAALVTDADSHLLGIFTGRDAVRLLAQGRAAADPMESVMTRAPDTMPPGRTAIEAMRLMQDGGFRHVPVVEHGVVVGVVSWGDFRISEHDRLDTETGLWERM